MAGSRSLWAFKHVLHLHHVLHRVPVLLDSSSGQTSLPKDPRVSFVSSCMEWVCMTFPRDLWKRANRHWITDKEVNPPCQNERSRLPSWKTLGRNERKDTRAMGSHLLQRFEKQLSLAASAAKFKFSPRASLPSGLPGCASSAPDFCKAKRRRDMTSSCGSGSRVSEGEQEGWAGREQGRLFRLEWEGCRLWLGLVLHLFTSVRSLCSLFVYLFFCFVVWGKETLRLSKIRNLSN